MLLLPSAFLTGPFIKNGAAQFTLVKCWQQPECPPVNEWIKNCGTFTQWNTTQHKEGAPTIWDSMDGTGEHYAK